VQVALALPGGDPLQAAIAAGETPSPEMVAASGGEAGLRPALAVACLAAVVVGLLAAVWVSNKLRVVHKVPLDNPPEVLARKAREIAAQLGYPDKPADSIWDFTYNTEFLNYAEKNSPSPLRWDNLQPQAILFRYRESPQYFQTTADGLLSYPSVSMALPPSISGMINLGLDPQGRLLWFNAVPSQIGVASAIAPDWAILLRAAGLDAVRLTQVEPQWTPPTAFDIRIAWTGISADQSSVPIRIEAASWRGRPVYFEIVYPWSLQSRIELHRFNLNSPVSHAIFVIVLLVVGVLIARLNHRRGVGDYLGTFKLTWLIFSLNVLKGIFLIRYTYDVQEIASNLFRVLSSSMYQAGAVGLAYFAFEPYVRRYWPTTFISWSRVMTGRLHDPLVGRDVLIGTLGGIAVFLVGELRIYNIDYFHEGHGGEWPFLSPLLGMRIAGGYLLDGFSNAVETAIAFFFVLFFVRALLRREWLVLSVAILIFIVTTEPIDNLLEVSVYVPVLYMTILLVLGLRVGLVASFSSLFADIMIGTVPVTLDVSAWYAGVGIFASLAVLAMAVWSFHTSLGGQKLFQRGLLEE
jgi:hypothetical protein